MKHKYTMVKWITRGVLMITLVALTGTFNAEAQVATNYNFTTSSNPYIPITGGITPFGAGDDDNYYLDSIGFQFYYNGASFNQVWTNTNGFIKLGDASTPPSSTYYAGPPISLNANCISALCNDLMGQLATRATSEIRMERIGTAPYRVYVVQFKDWSSYPGDATTSGEYYNFQIRLNENDGNGFVDIQYGNVTTTNWVAFTARPSQVGISGATVNDFNIRTNTASYITWDSSLAGTLNTDGMGFYTGCKPSIGTTFSWNIAPSTMVIDSISTKQITDGVTQGSTNNPIIAAVVYTHGNLSRKRINQLNFNTAGTTNTANIQNAKVFSTGTSSTFTGILHQYGSTIVSPSGAMTFTGNDTLFPGANYFWLTYDVAPSTTLANQFDATCTNVTHSVTQTVTPNITAPAGSRETILPMVGSYTINPAGTTTLPNFQSWDAALAALQKNGISGSVTITVSAGTYTVTAPITINKIAGVSSTKRVVFNGVNAANTIITGNIPSSPVVLLNECKYVAFRNFSVINTATVTCAGITIHGSATDKNAGSSCSVVRCNISLPNVGTTANTYCLSLTDDINGISVVNSILIDSAVIDSNTFSGGYYGIAMRGGLNNSFNTGVKIRNNTFTDVYYYSMWLYYIHNTIDVLNNTLTYTLPSYGNYGIYMYRCDVASTQNIIGNKIYNFYQYGIYVYAEIPNTVKIYNNLAVGSTLNGIRCLYLQQAAGGVGEVFHNTFVFNYASANTTYGPVYTTGSGNINVNNNILLVNSPTGATTCLYLNTPPTANTINNNVYYNKASTNLVYRNAVTYTPANFKNIANGGDSSYNVLSTFMGASDYNLQDACNPKGGDLLAYVPTDINGTARATAPSIGCYEKQFVANDMTVKAILQPTSPVAFGLSDVNVLVRNVGSGSVSSFNLSYKLNGGAAVSQTLMSSTLNSCDTISVLFTGAQQASLVGINNLSVYTSQPNSVADSDRSNDTLKATYYTALNGTYTIGGVSPNFATFADALNVLQIAGVSGPVIFNVAAGTYNEQVVINGPIIGSSNVNTVKFVGASAATTIISANRTQQGVVVLNQCKYVSFDKFTINNTNTANPVGFAIVGNITNNNGTGCGIKNSIINIATAAPANTSYGIAVTASANGYGLSNNYIDSVQIDSNIVNGASYGISIHGNSTTLSGLYNRFHKVRGNTVNNIYAYGIYVYYVYNAVDVLNNNINMLPLASTTATTYGLYFYYCQNTTAGTAHNIIGNRSANANYMDMYIYYYASPAATPAIIANNIVYGTGNYTTRYGMYVYTAATAANVKMYHNTVIMNSGLATALYGVYWYNTTGTVQDIKNNIFGVVPTAMSSGTTTYPLYCNNNLAALAIDNNIYFNNFNTNLVYRGGTTYTPTTYKVAAGGGLNSRNVVPAFTNLQYPAVTIGCYQGANLTADVPTDFMNVVRSTTPTIGAYEFSNLASDLMVEQILSPGLPLSSGTQDVVVRIRNNGTTILSAFNIGYRLNGGTPVVQAWTGSPLNACDTATVTFTGVAIVNGANAFKVYTAVAGDGNMLNDTITATLYPALSGTYVVGAAPSDFLTLTLAATALKERGVAGPVVFNVKNGTYTESVEITPVVGASAVNNITFKSLNNDPSLVTITSTTDIAKNYTFKVNQAQYINLRALKIVSTGTTYAHTLELLGITSYDTIENCIITAPQVAGTATDVAALFAVVPNGNIVIRNNTITGGNYGLYLFGTSTTILSPGNVIDNNTISGAYYYTNYIYYTNNLKFRNNTITVTAPIYSTHYAATFYYSYNAFEFSGNKVTATGLTSTIYGVQLVYLPGTVSTGALVKNNTVVVGTSGTTYGFYTQYGTYANYFNNSVNSISTGATNYAAYIYQSSTTYNNNTYRNNIFCNSGSTGYAMYNYNPIYMTGANNLLYSNSAAGLVYKGLATATAYPTLNAYKTAFPDQEKNTLVYRPAFTSASNLQPNAADSAVWAINGRGVHSPLAATDINGVVRPTTTVSGTPDIGAYEVTPTSIPPLATATPAIPSPGTTQTYMFANDTVASITWDISSQVPAALNVRFYSGVWPPNASFPTDFATNCYWKTDEVGANPPYMYNMKLKYYEPMLGTIPVRFDMKLAQLTGTFWTPYMFASSLTDSFRLQANSLSSFSIFTGTDNTTPLPVRLASFNAQKADNDVKVLWQTASEVNAAYYEVERSTDGEGFAPVGRVRAKGNSRETNNYTFTDVSSFDRASVDLLYYRLKMVDADGTFEYTRTVAVSRTRRSEDGVSNVYPNPFNKELNIELTAETKGIAGVEIKDITGKTVFVNNYDVLSGSSIINISGIPALQTGFYFVSVELNGTTKVIKLLKE